MEYTEQFLQSHPVFHHFFDICKIPHGSGHEQELSDHLLKWAKMQGLDVEQDAYSNLFIKKPASPGYEDLPTLMLQAHIDMVCEKAEDVEHDFEKDPIQWIIEDDLLTTGGRTTLGADDGIGAAFCLALIADSELQHPALEVLLTTNEEEDMSGAEHFDTTKSCATRLINLDHASEYEILCGSCGGRQVNLDFPMNMQPVPASSQAYILSVHGLHGGHSGEDIHRGHGNANIVLARLLMALEKTCDCSLHSINGGTFRLAIPRQAQAVLFIRPDDVEPARLAITELTKLIRNELSESGSQLSITFEPDRTSASTSSKGVPAAHIIDAMVLTPDGIYQMNESLTGLVDASDNLGEITLDENGLHFVLEIRSARESLGIYLYQRMERLARILGGTCHYSNTYPSWDFRADSPLREKCERVYETCFGRKANLLTVHAGLEVGYLSEKNKLLDAVAIGPNAWNFHSPSECVSISSTVRVYDFLRSLLSDRT